MSTRSNEVSSVWPNGDPPFNLLNISKIQETLSNECFSSETWNTVKIIAGIILSLVIFTSLGGNLLVCIAIYSSRRLRKLGNIFLASLALADLLVSILVETFALANDLMNRWAFGQQFCEIWIAFDVMCCTASILNLCAISLDRFIHIKDPFRYRRWMTRKVAFVAVASIWTSSALISFVPVTLGLHKPADHDPLQDEQQCSLDLTPTYAAVSSSISFYLPGLVMITIYYRLYLYAMKHAKNIRTAQRVKPDNGRTDSATSANSVWKQSRDRKAAITLGIIMGTFLVCWAPFFCINIIAAFCKTCISNITFKCLTWLGYFNSALNPIIYSIFNVEFRKAFKRILFNYAQGECCLGMGLIRKDSDSSWSRWSSRRKSPVMPHTEITTLREKDVIANETAV